jgi:Uncharacterized conserved protein
MFNFDDASRKSRETMEEMLKSYSEMAKGFQTIAAEAGNYSRRSFQDVATFMESLMSARGVEDVYQLQADYMKSSYDAFVAEAAKLSELYADLAKSAYAPKSPVPAAPSTAIVTADAA